jgi:cysteine desulfurase
MPNEVVFTSGGSEANNHALKGIFYARRRAHPHIITSQVEHPAILNPCRFLEQLGAQVTFVPVDAFGRVDPDDVRRAIASETMLISIMHANNEVGTIQPIAEIGRVAHEHGIPFHTDAAQSVGKISTHVCELGVDLLSVAGHKLYAPKGVGALYVRTGLQLEPLVHGAGHEAGRRAGTENILLDVALGTACELSESWIGMESIAKLRDRFWNGLTGEFGDGVLLNGHPTERLPNTLNVSFPGRVGADILHALPGVAASTGSACHSGSVRLSPVLEAMRTPAEAGMGAIRFSLGRSTTAEEIDEVLDGLKEVLA